MEFNDYLENRIVLFDGAMGTEIQKLDIQDDEWGEHPGCNEILNLTASHHIAGIHHAYLEAGADVIETNTFGANRIVLEEYGLQDRTREINRKAAALAAEVRDECVKEAGYGSRFVAGSLGPGTKLPSLGQVDFDTLHFSYLEQARGLMDGGVDLFIIETCQDLLQIKTAVIAVQDAMRECGRELPVIVSMTVESGGSLLVGSDIPSVTTSIASLGIGIIGVNCATGPTEMRPHIKELSSQFGGTLFCMPNAGFPVQRDGRLVYDLPPEEFADILTSIVNDFGVQIIGGCCGTGPAFTAELRRRLSSLKVPERDAGIPSKSSAAELSSLYSRQDLHQEPPPFFVGERINSNGSARFRSYLLQEDWESAVSLGMEQKRTGAHGLDVCVAYAGRNEIDDMRSIVRQLTTRVDLPLIIDSTDPEVIEAGLKLIGGRALINSVNLENGEDHADRLFSLARRYGAAIIALTIDEEGMARETARKLEVASRLYKIATEKHGLTPSDIVFDPLTFTLGSGDTELKESGIHTLQALSALKRELPGVHTVLGISNISFGLSPRSREVLNSVFLDEAIRAGLDLAIVNVHRIIPLHRISPEERDLALDLIYRRGEKDPLLAYINHFNRSSSSDTELKKGRSIAESPEERLELLVLEGSKTGLSELLDELMKSCPAAEIISDHLIPAMQKVGEFFGTGKLQLPFVLQSAEVMKKAVDYLEPCMDHKQEKPGKKVVLATVRGDVHDIGKNLVDIILSNNGYEVFNLGIKVDIETMIEKAAELKADAIGMSGLLVKSTQIMKANLQELQRRDMQIPVLLGGAALTEKFVREECAPLLKAPVFYCRDAFDGLHALQEISGGKEGQSEREAGRPPGKIEPRRLPGEAAPDQGPDGAAPGRRVIDEPSGRPPLPPTFDLQRLIDIDPEKLFTYINRSRLFRSRWRYRRGAESEKAYLDLEQRELVPLFDETKKKLLSASFLRPRISFRFLPCGREGDDVVLLEPETGDETARFHFTRQLQPPFGSVADFFRPLSGPQGDLLALQIVTLGPEIAEEIHRLFREDDYREYLHLHGLAVELTEALADYTQNHVEKMLYKKESVESEGKSGGGPVGTRYSFGYPCCPDLSTNRTIAELLEADRLGITFSEDDQMVPEFSTSAFICFNPLAEYI